MARREAVRLELLREQEASGDVDLLVVCVPGQLDDLAAVQQRVADCVERVRGGYEEDLGKVEGDIDVMILRTL